MNTKRKTEYDFKTVKKFFVEERNENKELEKISASGYLRDFLGI